MSQLVRNVVNASGGAVGGWRTLPGWRRHAVALTFLRRYLSWRPIRCRNDGAAPVFQGGDNGNPPPPRRHAHTRQTSWEIESCRRLRQTALTSITAAVLPLLCLLSFAFLLMATGSGEREREKQRMKKEERKTHQHLLSAQETAGKTRVFTPTAVSGTKDLRGRSHGDWNHRSPVNM